jgi:octaprenyl-diphosphate synthase
VLLLEPIAADLQAVDQMVRERLRSDVALIGTIADYIVGAGGKRLRPAVLLMVARALGYRGLAHITLAAVIEFIHTATLLHDDVVDESDLRRGRPTSNAAFGNASSVLVGDFLYSRSFQMMVDVDSMRIMRILADATNRIAEGEVLQLMNIHDPTVDEARYLRVVECKTATLFEASARLAAVLCAAEPALEQACARYGAALGTAFQIIDDVLDYDGDPHEIGKRVGDDLREGKATLPVIHAYQHGAPAERAAIDQVLADQTFERVSHAEILAILERHGSVDYALAAAYRYADLARALVADLPESDERRALLWMPDFVVARDK